jgi:hypothetical protein
MIESKDHHKYQVFCEKLRETPFWDRFFLVHDIFSGELNAWAKNYEVEALQSYGINGRCIPLGDAAPLHTLCVWNGRPAFFTPFLWPLIAFLTSQWPRT